MGKRLFLTVTRACNLRCTYCPTAKDGWPSLTEEDARASVRLFAERYGGGEIKLFGGEPLLVPDVVRAAFDEALQHDNISRVYLSTNGLGLDPQWLEYLRAYPKAVLTLSMDGKPEDHRRTRRALEGVPDCYDHILSLRDELLATPRVVITQTIAPATAERAAENFEHLAELGFWRFNFLPGYYIPWKESQLTALEGQFAKISQSVQRRWKRGERFYVRNLFTWAPTPFFNTGLVIDSDRSIHPSNLGLSGSLDDTRELTMVGTLDDPPSQEALDEGAKRVNGILQDKLPPRVWESTNAVDNHLSTFCRSLYEPYAQYRIQRRGDEA
jgi:sulfatase maturation enzyme AslB (radical SAM superfamily)